MCQNDFQLRIRNGFLESLGPCHNSISVYKQSSINFKNRTQFLIQSLKYFNDMIASLRVKLDIF